MKKIISIALLLALCLSIFAGCAPKEETPEVNLLPDAKANEFRPVDGRSVSGLKHCEDVAELTGLTLDL